MRAVLVLWLGACRFQPPPVQPGDGGALDDGASSADGAATADGSADGTGDATADASADAGPDAPDTFDGVECPPGGSPCFGTCCEGAVGGFQCMSGVAIVCVGDALGCDGPEDCGARCCTDGSSTYCEVPDVTPCDREVCHTSSTCTDGDHDACDVRDSDPFPTCYESG